MSSSEVCGREREVGGPLPPSDCSLSKLGWKRAKWRCLLRGAQSYDQRQAYNLALQHDEFRGSRSDIAR
ncbi:hypothetical protein TNCV_449731 [Trichonephila clavipes]|nr:hypothetical protein TNCV_449731 [Trichonephila clavipes]